MGLNESKPLKAVWFDPFGNLTRTPLFVPMDINCPQKSATEIQLSDSCPGSAAGNVATLLPVSLL